MRVSRILSLPWREWAPAALVSALVLAGGARLIVLGTQQRIQESRDAATEAARRTASSIEAEVEALARRAHRQAARAADELGRARLPERLGSVAAVKEAFWMTADGSTVPGAYPTDDEAAREALARGWGAGGRHSEPAGTEWLAPLRQGSQWLVSARAPILLADGNDVERAGWAVVYRTLEAMLLDSGVDDLPDEGYELALGQPAPGADALRTLVGSPFVASSDHVTGAIRLPDTSSASDASEPYLLLALRPSAGWYSRAALTADVGLLLTVTWLLALAAYDLVHSQHRWRAALGLARQRLAATNRRLTEELEGRRRLQLSFEHARFHDTFTGLGNRRYFMNQLDRALRDVRGGRRQSIAVILVDIDRFKLINETLGQTAGDELMVQAARRFENKMGDFGCVLARWSGDQFALLLYDVHSSKTAVAFAKLLGESLARPFFLRKHTLSVAAHMGITCVDAQLQRAEDVVREADIALSFAKKREHPDPVVYDDTLGEDVVTMVSLEADLHVALEREQFRLLFQPILDLDAGRIVGTEALLRWRHPIEGLLAPDRFLPLAEEARLIVPISRWVLRRACKLGSEWRRHLRPDTDFYVSVNLAATVLDDPQIVPYVADILRETGLPPEFLRLELTESDLTPHMGAAREVLDAFHGMGVGLVLDDFGTGYSSLSYLELFPIDCVKIDRPVVNAADGSDNAIMRSVLHMALSLGLETVAEKVETETAVAALARMGCRYGQGYLLGKPLEPEELLARLTAQAPVPATTDTPTLAQPGPPGPAAPDEPTGVQLRLPGGAAPDEPTGMQLKLPGRAAPDDPTLVQLRPPGSAAPDEPTSGLPGPTGKPAPDDSADGDGDGDGDGDETSVLTEAPADAADDDSPTQTRLGRR